MLLAAWLPTARQVDIVELLTVTKPSGAVWRYATSVDNVADGAATWLGSSSTGGLLWRRSRLVFKAGIELSDCTLIVSARAGDTVNALPVAAALRAGAWDAATFLLSRAYFDAAGTLRGVLPRYQGQLAPMRLRDGDIELTLKPPSQILNRAVPPVYQSACHNTLFDTGCGLFRWAWTKPGTAQAGSTAAQIQTNLRAVGTSFQGGVITFTSGELAGLARTIRQQLGGGVISPFSLGFFTPFPQAPAAGDAFTLTPGCNRSLGEGGCAKFDNRLRFRGTPFIPRPETAL